MDRNSNNYSKYTTMEKLKTNCVVTFMLADDQDFVMQLVSALSAHFDSVRLLALGNADDICVLKSEFDHALSLEDLTFDFVAERLIVLSVEAFYELGTYFSRFKETTLWFDPTLALSGEKYELLSSVTAANLSEFAMDGICVRDSSGKEAWEAVCSSEIPEIPILFKPAKREDKIEPLIERKGVPRILIDGSSDISNYHMVDAFIATQKLSTEIEVWCVYDGELKPWMRPDFQISSIPREQLELYLSSVDAVVVVGSQVSAIQIANYISAGVLPFIIDDPLIDVMDNVVSVKAVKEKYPSFGTDELMEQLSGDASALQSFSSHAQSVLRDEMYFDYSMIKSVFVDSSLLSNYQNSINSEYARRDYYSTTYGDCNGSALHKKLKQDAHMVGEIDCDKALEGTVTGWSVDVASLTNAQPLVLSGELSLSTTTNWHNRQDVIEHFQIDKVENIGFTAKFIVPSSIAKISDGDGDGLVYGLKIDNSSCVEMNTMLDHLDLRLDSERLAGNKYDVVDNSDVKGCVETLNFSNLFEFRLNEKISKIVNCEYRIKAESEYLCTDSMDIYVSVNDVVSKIEGAVEDDYIIRLPQSIADNDRVILFVGTSSDESVNPVCVVSSSLGNDVLRTKSAEPLLPVTKLKVAEREEIDSSEITDKTDTVDLDESTEEQVLDDATPNDMDFLKVV